MQGGALAGVASTGDDSLADASLNDIRPAQKTLSQVAMALMHGDITERTDKSIASHADISACTASACLRLITMEYIACIFHSDDCVCGNHASARNSLQSM